MLSQLNINNFELLMQFIFMGNSVNGRRIAREAYGGGDVNVNFNVSKNNFNILFRIKSGRTNVYDRFENNMQPHTRP